MDTSETMKKHGLMENKVDRKLKVKKVFQTKVRYVPCTKKSLKKCPRRNIIS